MPSERVVVGGGGGGVALDHNWGASIGTYDNSDGAKHKG